MAAMHESCSVCNREFDVQFRYQMEERDGGFLFFCSQTCQGKSVRGETSGGSVVCDACSKRFSVELVSQVVRGSKGARKYACGAECRAQLISESQGVRLAQLAAPPAALVPPIEPAAPAAPTTTVPPPPPSTRRLGVKATSSAAASRALAPFDGPRRLAIFNHKGGTGKTTTTVSIAAGLAERGLRVLLVDTDSQGNVAVSFGVKPEKTLYHVLVMGLRAEQAATTVRPNLDLLPSNETLAAAELYLAGRQNRDRVLRDRLASATDAYDVVILDCSPSLSLMNQNALVFADGILVPVACDYLSLVGVRQVIKTVKNVNGLLRHPVQIYGVLPTFYDARARICRDAVETLTQHFGERCFAPVRAGTRLKEAPAQGKTIFEHAPDSHAAEDYRAVVERLITGRVAAPVDLDTTPPSQALAANA
ncbi:MAG TPA: ParA family protein [Polyangiaceae bacterium]|nr:ParA family protein [Polyangiaceae bacterium]